MPNKFYVIIVFKITVERRAVVSVDNWLRSSHLIFTVLFRGKVDLPLFVTQ